MKHVLMRLSRRSGAVAFVVLAAIGVGVAVASIPNGDIINGCRNRNSGALRVVDPALSQKCTAAEAALNWPAFTQTIYTQTPPGFRSSVFSNAGDLEIFTAHVPRDSYMVTATVNVTNTTAGSAAPVETVVKCQIASSDGRGSTGETLLKDIDEANLTLQAPGDPANGTWGIVCSATDRPLSGGPGGVLVTEVAMKFVPASVTPALSTTTNP